MDCLPCAPALRHISLRPRLETVVVPLLLVPLLLIVSVEGEVLDLRHTLSVKVQLAVLLAFLRLLASKDEIQELVLSRRDKTTPLASCSREVAQN